MKKLLFVSLIIVTMLLSACQSDLPPEPGSIGVVGQAEGYEDLFAEPDKFTVKYDPLYYGLEDPVSQSAKVEADYIWHTGYYLSLAESKWLPFEFTGNKVAGKWLPYSSVGGFEYTLSAITEDKVGVVLAYSCNKEGDVWDCHGNKWMLQTFDFVYKECDSGEKRCIGNLVETCLDNDWKVTQKCSALEICEDGECLLDLPPEPEGPGIPDDEEDVFKVETQGNKYNMYDTIKDVWNLRLTNNELPTLLATETYVDDEGDNIGEYTYDQYLYVGLGNQKTGEFNFFVPEDQDINYYLELEKGREIYRYQLEFPQSVQFDLGDENGDFAGTEIRIQGKDHIITYADALGGVLYKLVLMSGDSRVWFTQDQPYTVSGHIVQVVDVNYEEDKCGVNVDEVTKWIDVGDTEEFRDISIGVIDAKINLQNIDADTCELMLGAVEIELENGEEVVINNEKLEGSEVVFNGGPNMFSGFTVYYIGGQEDEGVNSDDVYLGEAAAWVDPVFGEWRLLFDSVDYKIGEKSEEITFSSHLDEAYLTFQNDDGAEVEIPFFNNNGSVEMGNDIDEPMLDPGEWKNINPEGVMLLFVDDKGSAHVLVIDNFACDNNNGEVTIDDITYDRDAIADGEAIVCGAPQKISLGSLGEITLVLNHSFIWYDNEELRPIRTYYGGELEIGENYYRFTENSGPEQSVSSIDVILTYDVVDQAIEVDTVMIDGALPNWHDILSYDDDVQWVTTERGSVIALDAEDRGLIEIYHPAEETTANVYITRLGEIISHPDPIPERCLFPAGLDCIDRASICHDTDKVIFPLRNNVGFEIEILDVQSQGCNGYTSDEFVDNNDFFFVALACNDFVKDQRVDLDVVVTYRNTESQLTHEVIGYIAGPADEIGCDTCSDSDNGKNYYIEGDCTGFGGGGKSDYCNFIGTGRAGVLKEASCGEVDCVREDYVCPDGEICRAGRCMEGNPEDPICVDTDGGKNAYQKGTVHSRNLIGAEDNCYVTATLNPPDGSGGEHCSKDMAGMEGLYCGVYEYYCENDDYADTTFIECPNGCSDGACLGNTSCQDLGGEICSSYTPTQTCSGAWIEASDTGICCSGECIIPEYNGCVDSDGGLNYNLSGIVTVNISNPISQYNELRDYCQGDLLYEFYCGDLGEVWEGYDGVVADLDNLYQCPDGCLDGACI